MESGISESYWKENGEAYARGIDARRPRWEDPTPLSADGFCVTCDKQNKLQVIGLTTSHKMQVWACPDCDAGLLNNIRKNEA